MCGHIKSYIALRVWSTSLPGNPMPDEKPTPEPEGPRRDDTNVMRMIRSYKGVGHETGQKVRGQRTRSNGRTGLTVGVTKKAALEAAKAKKAEEAAPKKEEKKEEKKPAEKKE